MLSHTHIPIPATTAIHTTIHIAVGGGDLVHALDPTISEFAVIAKALRATSRSFHMEV